MFDGGGSTHNKYELNYRKYELDLSSATSSILVYFFFTTTSVQLHHHWVLHHLHHLHLLLLPLAAQEGRPTLQIVLIPRGRRRGQPTARAARRAGKGGASHSRGQLLKAAPGLLPPMHPDRAGGREVGAARVAPAAHLEGLAVEPPAASWCPAAGPTTATRGPPRPPGAAAPYRSPWTACGSPECGTRMSSLSSASSCPWSASPSSPRCCCRHPSGKTKLRVTISS